VRITYVLASNELNGGHKVAFQQVDLLRRAGHELTLLSRGERPSWPGYDGPYHDLDAGPPQLASQDLVVGTFWTTLPVARDLGVGPVAHLCQGYEAGLEHLESQRPAIEEVYRLPIPALVVSPHLGDLLRERFGRQSVWTPPPLDRRFRPATLPRLAPRRRPRIAIPGIYEAPVKGVREALDAVARVRAAGIEARVLRVSFRPLTDEERARFEPSTYLCAVPPERVARELRACDLLLFGSRREEGFGLPLLEAMASGVPAVSFAIPSVRCFAEGAVQLVEPEDAKALGSAAFDLLGDAAAWRRARRRGLRAAARFRPEAVAPRLLDGVRWAASQA